MECKVIRLNKPLTLPQLYQVVNNWIDRADKIKFRLDGCEEGENKGRLYILWIWHTRIIGHIYNLIKTYNNKLSTDTTHFKIGDYHSPQTELKWN